MNYQSARLVFNQMALWAVLLLVVGLLTLLFSLLGTIFCAVVVGVMMGASRRWRWQAIPVSVVFPLVIVTLSRVSKTELDWHHTIQMAVLCFAVFWATYAATYLLMFLERPSERPAPTRGLRTTSASAQTSEAEVVECSLADLRGTWVCGKLMMAIPETPSAHAMSCCLSDFERLPVNTVSIRSCPPYRRSSPILPA